MDVKTIALFALGGAGIYFLTKNKTATPTSLLAPGSTGPITATSQTSIPNSTLPNAVLTNPAVVSQTYPYLLPGSPSLPSTYNQAFYEMYVYPAMVKANPNVTNSSYNLSDADVQQYMSNYNDLKQGFNDQVAKKTFKDVGTAARFHWQHNGVPEKRTFLQLLPTTTGNYTPPPVNANSKGSGGGFLGTLKSVASTVGGLAALLGDNSTKLSDEEIQVLLQGAAIMKDILPYYRNADPKMYNAIQAKVDSLINQYTKGY